MSANIAVIYAGDLTEIASAFGEAGADLSAQIRLLRAPAPEKHDLSGTDRGASVEDLRWADGIAFGTPVATGQPAVALMDFIKDTEPLWSSGTLFDKVVTVFTDEPEHFAPDSVVHPIYEALYYWGAVIVGPRARDLAIGSQPGRKDRATDGMVSAARLRTARYRGRRLAVLAGVLRAERARHERLEL